MKNFKQSKAKQSETHSDDFVLKHAFQFRLLTCLLLLSTSVIAQSVKLPISNGEYIDFNDPNNPILNSLPIHPNSGFTSPVTDESVLYSNIVFDPTGGCPGIPGASVPLNDGNGDDGTVTPLYYLGQSPAYCSNIVTDDYGM